jgi:Flp pilus assembly secretin CpaC
MTSMLRACLIALALLAVTNSLAKAADRTTITLRLGTGSALTLERPFATVLIGDPLVVDVHEQSDRAVILEPLDVGATNVVFVDARSIAIANVRVLVCASVTRASDGDSPDCE